MAQLTLVLNRTEVKRAEIPAPGSARIRAARSVLCELLMLDEEETVLVGSVSEPLNAIALELDRLAGLQQLYELWVG